jgi:prophage regulatory protein
MKILLRLKDLQEVYPASRSGIYSKIADGLLPPPVKLGSRMSAWPLAEINAVLEARIAGKPEDEIRKLVKNLVIARKRVA